MIPKGIGMPSTSPHPMGMSPDTYARRRLLLAQRAGVFRGPIPTGNAAAVWRNFSSNLAGDAQQYGYANPIQWLRDSAREGSPVHGPQFLGGPQFQQQQQAPAPVQTAVPAPTSAPSPQFMGSGGYPGAPQTPGPLQGFMAAENPEIKQLLAQALAALQQGRMRF